MEFYINWWSQTNFSMCYRAWHVSFLSQCACHGDIFSLDFCYSHVYSTEETIFKQRTFIFQSVILSKKILFRYDCSYESFIITHEYIKNFWLKIILITDFNNSEIYFYRKREFSYIFIFHLSIIYSIWWIFYNLVYRLYYYSINYIFSYLILI